MTDDDVVKDPKRRKFLATGVAGAVVVASLAGYTLLRLSDGSYVTRTDQGAQTKSSGPSDPTFDADGVQLPSLTSDPPHREGSVYFRSDLLQVRLDDGTSYYSLPKKQAFSKGCCILAPSAQTIVIWRAPSACTVTAVKAYQDVGTGSVATVYDGNINILESNIAISSAATWQDGGSLALTAVSTGDSIAIEIVSVAGSPNYISVQIEFTQP